MEFSGVPVRFKLEGTWAFSVADTNQPIFNVAASTGAAANAANVITGGVRLGHVSVITGAHGSTFTWDWLPAAGSYQVGPVWKVSSSGGITLFVTALDGSNAGYPSFSVEEIVRQNATND
jgi:hypothetical protein